MIRCIPVDGSEPFDVPDNEAVVRCTKTGTPDKSGFGHEAPAIVWAGYDNDSKWAHRSRLVRGRLCRIESWRERADRLEKELAAARDELREYHNAELLERRMSQHG